MPITPRERLAGTWTGTELIIWGGSATYGEADDPREAIFSDGAIYDPENDSWRVISPSPLTPRCDHTGTWTGEVFIVVGGLTDCDVRNVLADSGIASYQPATDQWPALSPQDSCSTGILCRVREGE
jgi:N-acetylneuraminic acid mutarotase